MVMLIAARRLLMGDADSVIRDDKNAFAIGDVSQFVEGQGQGCDKRARFIVQGRKTTCQGLRGLPDSVRQLGSTCDLKQAVERFHGLVVDRQRTRNLAHGYFVGHIYIECRVHI